jgi:hypothetical protein
MWTVDGSLPFVELVERYIQHFTDETEMCSPIYGESVPSLEREQCNYIKLRGNKVVY